MSSPFEKIINNLEAEASLPSDDSWIEARLEGVRAHASGVKAVVDTIDKMGALVLDGRISTDLKMRGESNINQTNPSDAIACADFSIVPVASSYGRDPVTQHYAGDGWQPEVAMHVNLKLEDSYDYTDKRRDPRPTGQVALSMYVRTWGSLSSEDIALIKNGEDINNRTWAQHRDNGWYKNGMQIGVYKGPGNTLSLEDAESIFAPLSQHIVNYFDITDQKKAITLHRPGTFSTHKNVPAQIEPNRSGWRGRRNRQPPAKVTKGLAISSLHYFQL